MATRSTSVVKTGSAAKNWSQSKPGVIVRNTSADASPSFAPRTDPAVTPGPPKSSPSGIVVRRK